MKIWQLHHDTYYSYDAKEVTLTVYFKVTSNEKSKEFEIDYKQIQNGVDFDYCYPSFESLSSSIVNYFDIEESDEFDEYLKEELIEHIRSSGFSFYDDYDDCRYDDYLEQKYQSCCGDY